MGSGKTGTVRAIVEQAVEVYGKDNVNAVLSREGNIVELLDNEMDKKLVQILICDDASLRDITDEDLRKFFKVRHKYKEITGNSNGYLITIFNVHRFHSLKTELRTNIDIAIWRTPPTSPYDKSVIKKFVGTEGLEDLAFIEEKRLNDPEWNAVSVFSSRTTRGLLLLDQATVDHVRIASYGNRFQKLYEKRLKELRDRDGKR